MELPWFVYSIGATVLLGISIVFYKLPLVKNHSAYFTSFWANFFYFIFSAGFLYKTIPNIELKAIWYGGVWGLLYSITTLLQMHVLQKKVETNTLFSITSPLSMVLTVLFGIIALSEEVAWIQSAGILLILTVVIAFSIQNGKLSFPLKIMKFIFIIPLVSVLGKVTQKLGAVSTDLESFVISQSASAAFFSLLISLWVHRRTIILSTEWRNPSTIRSGIFIGFPSFLGGYLMVYALHSGPISLVYSIHSMYILVTAILGALIFKETLTKKKIFLILIAIIGIVLIRIG